MEEEKMPRTEDLVMEDFFVGVLYGASGTGKTMMAGTSEKPMYVFQMDPKGIKTLAGVPGIEYDDYWTPFVERPQEVERVYAALRKKIQDLKTNNPYKTICYDSLTFGSEMLIGYILKLTGRASLVGKPILSGSQGAALRESDYGTLAELNFEILKDLTAVPNAHIIITSHENEKIVDLPGDRQELVRLIAVHGQKFPKMLPGAVREIWRMDVLPRGGGQPPEYRVQTRSDRMWTAKTCFNVWDPRTQQMVSLLDMYEPADFRKIFEKIRRRKREILGQ